MTTTVDVGLVKSPLVLHGAREAGVVRLREDLVDQFPVCERVHDARVEVAAQAAGSWVVYREVGGSEGPGLNAAAAGPAGDVQRVLLGRGCDEVAVAAECCVGVEDGGVEGSR